VRYRRIRNVRRLINRWRNVVDSVNSSKSQDVLDQVGLIIIINNDKRNNITITRWAGQSPT